MPRKESSPARPETSAGTPYKVLARRWRPQQFDDLVGQEAIAQALTGAITAGRVAHAYLFTGARGVGKTSTARIFAKALNCADGPTTKPCGKCDPCEGIASGDDLDVLEVDGASNRGIDEVRELRQNANLRPTRTRYKIYIIDEVHMLTREAFNALLKTLEEPPEHVKFIFATTDPQKIPITILSRCQRFDFGTISSERIQQKLDEIVKAEGIPVDDEVLELLARRAAGSMRDALSLLDQLLAFGGERVTTEQVHRLLGTANEDRLLELIASLTGKSAGAAIATLDRAESEGVQLGELLDQLMDHFRDLMVAKAAGEQARLVSVSNRQRPKLIEQAGSLSLEYLLAAADILSESKNRLRGTSHGRVLVDVAFVRIANLEDLSSLGDLVARLQAIESSGGGSGAAARPAASASHPAPMPLSASPGDSKKNSAANASVTDPVGSVAAPIATSGAHAVSITKPLTAESATKLIRDLAADFNPMLRESVARAAVTLDGGGDSLVVQLDSIYNTPARAAEIETALQQRVGVELRVRVELASKAAANAATTTTKRSNYSERISEASRDPLVQQAIDLFGARVVRVDGP